MTYDQVAPYYNSLSFTLVICIVNRPPPIRCLMTDLLKYHLLWIALPLHHFRTLPTSCPSSHGTTFSQEKTRLQGDFSLRFHERSTWEHDSLLMTFLSGFSKTTQASGLKIKPGLRASWVIRKSKSHALGAVEGRFCKVGYRSQNNGHVCLPREGVERWKVETCDYRLD